MRHLAGPELFWLLLYLGAVALGKANTPPSKAIEDFIEPLWFWIPASSLILFGLWWMPSLNKGGWLLLRIWILGLVCSYLVAEKAYAASSFQGPGIGMGLVGTVSIQIFVLMLGTVAVGVKALWLKG